MKPEANIEACLQGVDLACLCVCQEDTTAGEAVEG